MIVFVGIFFSHTSPKGIHDQENEVHFGCDDFNTCIARAKPAILVHGHQHVDSEATVDQTSVIGVYGRKKINLKKINLWNIDPVI